jgi:hypothetical protein
MLRDVRRPSERGRFVDSFNPSRLTGFWAEFCKISDRNLIAHALLYGRLLEVSSLFRTVPIG